MARERIGRCYERLIATLIERLLKMRWKADPHATPLTLARELHLEAAGVGADLALIGPQGELSAVLFISHCTSPKNSDMKGWRNLEELRLIKSRIAPPPRVISVLFEGQLKESQLQLQKALFDQLILCEELPGWAQLQERLHLLSAEMTGSLDLLEVRLAQLHRRGRLGRALRSLEERLMIALWGQCEANPLREALDELWLQERRRIGLLNATARRDRAADVSSISLRHAVARLLLFPSPREALTLYLGGSKSGNFPEYLYRHQLITRSLAGPRGADASIQGALDALGEAQLIRLCEGAPRALLKESLSVLQKLDAWANAVGYFSAHFSAFCDPKKLSSALLSIDRDPHKPPLGGGRVGELPEGGWLFELIITLLKGSKGAQSRFGYSALTLSSAPISAWKAGRRVLSHPQCAALADQLSRELQGLSPEERSRGLSELLERLERHHLSNRLLTHRALDPLLQLLQETFPAGELIEVRSCFADAAALRGRAGRLRMFRQGHWLIQWQSVSEAGRRHKRRELCARGLSLRYRWDGTAFVPKQRFKLALFLDGSWTARDLSMFIEAGWDRVFRSSEVDRLSELGEFDERLTKSEG
ncbi:MAG: hypothetical protein VYD19_06735 [Myxococcota bacterium]|nr:hypothetical protein [Myxococcota bacterium]